MTDPPELCPPCDTPLAPILGVPSEPYQVTLNPRALFPSVGTCVSSSSDGGLTGHDRDGSIGPEAGTKRARIGCPSTPHGNGVSRSFDAVLDDSDIPPDVLPGRLFLGELSRFNAAILSCWRLSSSLLKSGSPGWMSLQSMRSHLNMHACGPLGSLLIRFLRDGSKSMTLLNVTCATKCFT
eukprot:3694219-Amphidinium_carterae.1